MNTDTEAPSGESSESKLGQAPFYDHKTLTENDHRKADPEFLDDLIAAHDMKGYLLASGVVLPREVIDGVNMLHSTFRSDIRERKNSIGTRYPAYKDLIGNADASEEDDREDAKSHSQSGQHASPDSGSTEQRNQEAKNR